jgi:hypothetical protein
MRNQPCMTRKEKCGRTSFKHFFRTKPSTKGNATTNLKLQPASISFLLVGDTREHIKSLTVDIHNTRVGSKTVSCRAGEQFKEATGIPS